MDIWSYHGVGEGGSKAEKWLARRTLVPCPARRWYLRRKNATTGMESTAKPTHTMPTMAPTDKLPAR